MPSRRKILGFLLSGLSFIGASAAFWWWRREHNSKRQPLDAKESMMPILKQFSLDFQWPTLEPFLFCVHHHDFFPKGTAKLGPDPQLLKGRNMGQDFTPKDGFRMYHGDSVPGFPVHPHRGFETITIVRKGYVDHADSLGAAGRYGQGDVQWMTAGQGVQHSEMFPLLRPDADNTLELFQIWLNLPKKSKMVRPHFKMLWGEHLPRIVTADGLGELTLIAGEYQGTRPPAPPPDSWASRPESETAIWLVKLKPGAVWEIPTSPTALSRALYFFEGQSLQLNGSPVPNKTGLALDSRAATTITAQESSVELLLLQSRPIGEPVVQYGPFVMNSQAEIQQAFADYQSTRFGGWPWNREDMVHGDKIERFAKYPDGKIERPS